MSTVETNPPVAPYFMRQPGKPFPPPEYADFRKLNGLAQVALPSGGRAWLITRHEDVRAVLTDPRISSDPSREGFPRPTATAGVPTPHEVPGWFVGSDAPDHTRLRKALISEFTIRRMKAIQGTVEEIVDGCIDRMLADGKREADLVNDFALAVPSLVIATMLGVPPADRKFFEAQSKVLVTISSEDEKRADASRQVHRYLNRLIALRRKRPADDMISRLVASGQVTDREIPGVAMLLLIAGHETTANNISLGAVTLMQNPQWIGDPRIVEELLRYHSVADLVLMRAVLEDIEIGGQLVRKGEGLVLLVAGANHDDAVFERAGEFDPSRSAQGHVAFGYGVHQCLGQNLVRIEMEVAYRKLFERIPTLEVAAPIATLPYKYDGVLFGLHNLPVRW
ncbi:cytochrome P450 [Streptomyces hoynatensis]|uniref:Cytochrome P450 n=1 Tax=Streptomyces hoynatensis TaxID=1141874 RepID=A0A3A9YYF2_9ACTN|nr:cytochrome P450 [Streptomyces hoynatensis]RKN41172.1 cytochrome P450 [Streptomyces hoynatensis]